METITTEITENYFREQSQRPLIYFLDEIFIDELRLEDYVGKKVVHDFKEHIKENTPKLNIDWSLVG